MINVNTGMRKHCRIHASPVGRGAFGLLFISVFVTSLHTGQLPVIVVMVKGRFDDESMTTQGPLIYYQYGNITVNMLTPCSLYAMEN